MNLSDFLIVILGTPRYWAAFCVVFSSQRRCFFVSKGTYRRPASDEAREHANAYRREYRRNNPERVKRWRDDYIIRKAAQLTAAANGEGQQKDGDDE